jgi:hypothetical protein
VVDALEEAQKQPDAPAQRALAAAMMTARCWHSSTKAMFTLYWRWRSGAIFPRWCNVGLLRK